MSRANAATPPLVGRLLWPERIPLTEPDRVAAAARVELAVARLGAESTERRLAQLGDARVRSDLRAVLAGLPDALPPPALAATVRVVTALWIVSGVTSILTWLFGGVLGFGWDWPWWIWTVAGGAPIVAGLWWTMEWDHRLRLADVSGQNGSPEDVPVEDVPPENVPVENVPGENDSAGNGSAC